MLDYKYLFQENSKKELKIGICCNCNQKLVFLFKKYTGLVLVVLTALTFGRRTYYRLDLWKVAKLVIFNRLWPLIDNYFKGFDFRHTDISQVSNFDRRTFHNLWPLTGAHFTGCDLWQAIFYRQQSWPAHEFSSLSI